MRIVIPSHKRSHLMVTWKHLPTELQDVTKIAVYPDEQEDYKMYPLLVLPPDMRGIANKRNYILQTCNDRKLTILDDDLTFAVRREDDPTKFRSADNVDILLMMSQVDQLLNNYAHGAIATREGGNRDINNLKFNTRALRAHFFRADILQDKGFTLNGTKFMSDFDSTLNLLKSGYENVVLNSYVTNQGGSNSVGGCSTTRTLDDLSAAAHLLAERHPEFVKTVQKTTKSAWGGGTRTDVRIQWKQAITSAPEVLCIQNTAT